jgi:hypothetical protein
MSPSVGNGTEVEAAEELDLDTEEDAELKAEKFDESKRNAIGDQISDLKEFVRRALAAALTQNKEQSESEVQKRVVSELHTRLAMHGFAPNRIHAIINAEIPTSHRPIYAKVHRKHLDIETLKFYELPYEDDIDPDYIIILREITPEYTEVLFEHTRNLRSKRDEDRVFGRSKRNDDHPFTRRTRRSQATSGSEFAKPGPARVVVNLLMIS